VCGEKKGTAFGSAQGPTSAKTDAPPAEITACICQQLESTRKGGRLQNDEQGAKETAWPHGLQSVETSVYGRHNEERMGTWTATAEKPSITASGADGTGGPGRTKVSGRCRPVKVSARRSVKRQGSGRGSRKAMAGRAEMEKCVQRANTGRTSSRWDRKRKHRGGNSRAECAKKAAVGRGPQDEKSRIPSTGGVEGKDDSA